MQSAAVVALALLESASAFQAPALKATTKAGGATMFSEGDLGVLPPLGVYDPLGLIETRDMRRYEIMEIKCATSACLFEEVLKARLLCLHMFTFTALNLDCSSVASR